MSNESVAHSQAFFSQGLNADCPDRLNSCVITKLSHGLIFQPALKFMLALHSPVFYEDIVVLTSKLFEPVIVGVTVN